MSKLAVIGAGGRAGAAIVEEAVSRGHDVTAVVRDPTRHQRLVDSGARLVAADVTVPATIGHAVAGHDAVVLSVTPFTVPPDSFEGFDDAYFVRAADACIAGMQNRHVRLLLIGLFATLRGADGALVLDDATQFPQPLRPYALAHLNVVEHLKVSSRHVDWVVLSPPRDLELGARSGAYEVGEGAATSGEPLTYADLAVATVDELEVPAHHRAQIAIKPSRSASTQ